MNMLKKWFNDLLTARIAELAAEFEEKHGDKQEEMEERLSELEEEFLDVAHSISSPEDFGDIEDAFHAWEHAKDALDGDGGGVGGNLAYALKMLRYPDEEVKEAKRTAPVQKKKNGKK